MRGEDEFAHLAHGPVAAALAADEAGVLAGETVAVGRRRREATGGHDAQVDQVYQIYHADDLWYDYYEQVAYLSITAVKLQYTDGSTLYLSGNSLADCVW